MTHARTLYIYSTDARNPALTLRWSWAGVKVGLYTHLVYVLPTGMAAICNWVGIAELPGAQTWFTADDQVSRQRRTIGCSRSIGGGGVATNLQGHGRSRGLLDARYSGSAFRHARTSAS